MAIVGTSSHKQFLEKRPPIVGNMAASTILSNNAIMLS